MSFAIAGSILNLFAAICVGCSGQFPAAWGILMLVPAAVSGAGAAAASAGSLRFGGYLVIAGSVFTLPVGLVGIYGGWRLLQVAPESETAEG